MMTAVFVLSLCICFIKRPWLRKWYSSSIGFSFSIYIFGIRFAATLTIFMTIWPVIYLLDRHKAYYIGNMLALLALTAKNLYCYSIDQYTL